MRAAFDWDDTKGPRHFKGGIKKCCPPRPASSQPRKPHDWSGCNWVQKNNPNRLDRPIWPGVDCKAMSKDTLNELTQLKQDAISRFKSFQNKAADAEAEIKVLEQAIALVQASKSNGGQGKLTLQAAVTASVRGDAGVVKAIYAAVSSMTGDFGIDEIEHKVRLVHPDVKREAVNWVLWRMARDNELITVQKGRGRRKSIYRRPEQK